MRHEINFRISIYVISIFLVGFCQISTAQASCLKEVAILGAEIESGSNKKGTASAPNRLRDLGLFKNLKSLRIPVVDKGNIQESNQRLIQPMQRMKEFIQLEIHRQNFPIIIGGDHSLSLASISGAQASLARGEELGVIIFDAHEDSYIDSGGYLHSSFLWDLTLKIKNRGSTKDPLKEIVRYIRPENIITIGSRNFNLIYLFKRFSVYELRKMVPAMMVKKILASFGPRVKRIHISFDIDVLDKEDVTGVNFPLPDGLKELEAIALITELAKSPLIRSADFVEYVPRYDVEDQTGLILNNIIHSFISALAQAREY